MHWTLRAVGAALALTVVTAVPAGAVSLRSYVVPAKKANLEKLAQAGFDVNEGRNAKRGTITITATRAQAAQLAKDGVEAERQPAARVIDDYGPGSGYRVYRPYARPAYNASGTATDNLVTQMQEMAADHPGIVKLVRIGTTAGGPEDPEHPDTGGQYTDPKPIYAVKVSRDARSEPDGSKPAVLYSSTQHAREWLATETNRRLLHLFVDNYGATGTAEGVDGAPVAGVESEELTQLVNENELWFILVVNPDGYDYTFQDEETRLWRKNLRDNDENGALTIADGVDPNRNLETHWGYDNEGSGSTLADLTYRGPGPGSEPESKAINYIAKRVNFEWNNNFHTCGPLLLYPFGWQVNTFAADDPIFRAIAGSDENPAVESYNPEVGGNYNPGVGAELYTTNGDLNDHLYDRYGTLSFTPELDPGDPEVDPETDGCFIFQDEPGDVQAVFESQVQFSLDMARSAEDPAEVESHLGNEAPNFEIDSFDVSFGDPQTVQVSAKRKLGPVTLHWKVGDGDEQTAPTSEWKGGERYGAEGDLYYHRMRGEVTGTEAGDTVKVWFTAEGAKSKSFTYEVEGDTGKPVLVIAAENYSGTSPAYADPSQPAFLGAHAAALDALGVQYDVWDVDAQDMSSPDPLGVLSHYEGVIWYTGDDFLTRDPGQPGGTGGLRVQNQLTLDVRDYLNEGGKLLYAGNDSGSAQFAGVYEYSQFGEPVLNTPNGYCDNVDQSVPDGCIPFSNDFFQYYLGGYILVEDAGWPETEDAPFDVFGTGPLDGLSFGLTPGEVSFPNSVVTTSSILDPAQFPQFASGSLLEYDRPGAAPYDPFTGEWYLFSGASDNAYRRLSKTVDLTGKTGGKLDFQLSYDVEGDYDWVVVEAHTPGEDDWTTLPITNDGGETVSIQESAQSCGGDGYTWLDDHPFLLHYMTPGADTTEQCATEGTSGVWQGLSVPGNSAGWDHLNVDLSDYDGQQVEVSVTYIQDPGVSGLGVFIDDLRTSAGAEELSNTSFEADLGGWTAADPPEGSPPNPDTWARTQSAIDETPGVTTEDSVWLTFGLETVDTDANRQALLQGALAKLGLLDDVDPEPTASPSPEPTEEPTAEPTASPTASPTATPTPEPEGRLALGSRPVRANRRLVSLRAKCIAVGGQNCRGTATLRRKGKAIATGAFRIPVDTWSTITVRMKRRAFRQLKRAGELQATYRAAARASDGTRYRESVRITVRAPS